MDATITLDQSDALPECFSMHANSSKRLAEKWWPWRSFCAPWMWYEPTHFSSPDNSWTSEVGDNTWTTCDIDIVMLQASLLERQPIRSNVNSEDFGHGHIFISPLQYFFQENVGVHSALCKSFVDVQLIITTIKLLPISPLNGQKLTWTILEYIHEL